MANSANVQAIETLNDLKVGLVRFRSDVLEALGSAERVIQQTNEWLDERRRYWQRQVEVHSRQASQTQAALAHCQASSYRDKDGRVHQPDCSGQQRAHSEALARLQMSRQELENVRRWTAKVHQAVGSYQRQAQAMKRFCGDDLNKATAFLERQSSTLYEYTMVRPTLGASLGQAAAQVQASMEPMSDARIADSATRLAGKALVTVAVGTVIAALAMRNSPKIRPGTRSTLQRANTLTSQEFDALTFSQPDHGFARAFVGKHAPLIVLESVSEAFDQSTPMPVTQRLSEVTGELGVDTTDAVVVHVRPDGTSLDVYQPTDDAGNWEVVERNLAFRQALEEILPDDDTLAYQAPYHRGVRNVPVSLIDMSDSPVSSINDFRKVSYQQMEDGFRKLHEVVHPALLTEADGDYFANLDTERGLTYESGYQRVYDAFYGDSAIRLEWDGERYQVTNGYHRLFVAREQGLSSVPAIVE